MNVFLMIRGLITVTKGLDLIQRQQPELIDGYPTGNVYIGLTVEELAELEKELKALEIIKKKNVNIIDLKKAGGLADYNIWYLRYNYDDYLTQEEFDLLKGFLS